MNSSLLGPDGQPAPKQVTITNDQALVMFQHLVGPQIGALSITFKVPAPVIADMLIKLVASLISPAPDIQRLQLVQQLTVTLHGEVARQAAERAVVTEVAGNFVNGKPQ